MNLTALLFVAAGGAIGSVARALVGWAIPTGRLPWATMVINVAGSLFIGWLFSRLGPLTETNLRGHAFWIVGICGGFTTFSAFSLQTDRAAAKGRLARGGSERFVVRRTLPDRDLAGFPSRSRMRRRLMLLVSLAWAGGLFAAAPADDPAARLIILANSRQPESVRLAGFYAEKRGVPPANIIALPLPETENITWREFIDQVYQPLQDELYKRGWLEGTATSLLDRFGRKRYAFTGQHISYLVTCRGVPLRIYNDPTLLDEKPVKKIPAQFNKNEGAVDAELSLLAQSGYDITAMVANPLFANERPASFDAEMVVKVSRLDGPTFESARHLVTSALEGESHGLLGRYYVDLKGPHPDGDEWLESTRTQLQDLGFDGDVERTVGTFGAEARFDAPVLYFGWYAGAANGPFAASGFNFPPGAIALHIHSFSAQTLHSTSQEWCGPLVARGVAATVGNVFEPYLQLSHRPNLLLHALIQGKNFGDAAYYALPALSWQAVAIGDPLYRPFKVSLEEQERSAGALPPALAPYAVIRRANLLWHQGKKAEAFALLRAGLKQQPSLPLALALARLAASAEDAKSVTEALGFIPALTQNRPEDWPRVREAAGLLAAHDARPAALAVYQLLAQAPAPTPEAHKALLTEARGVADAAGNLPLSLEFARQLAVLTPPLPAPPANKNPPVGKAGLARAS